MAAIISRITREKRDREVRLSKEIKSDQCVYQLPPFTARYESKLHNKVKIKGVTEPTIC